MAKIHDLFIIELAEVIKGYGNDPDVEDPFSLSEFYRFYELPNIAVSRENFEKMRPVEPERKTGKWIHTDTQAGYDINGDLVCADMMKCETCGFEICAIQGHIAQYNYCPNCGADMRGEGHE